MGGVDQMVSLWDLATCQPVERLRGHGGEIRSVAFSADGQKLASGSRDRTAMIWSTHPHRAETTVPSIISRPIFSANSQLFAAGIGQNKVVVWDVATLQPVAEFADAYDAVAFSADGRSVITRGTNCFLRTFDVEARAVLKNIPGRPAETNDSYAALSPNGQMLLVGLNEGPFTFSDAKTGVVLTRTTHAQGNRILQINFSPNGKLVATAGREAEDTRVSAVEIWDLATQKKVATLLGHTWAVISAAFSPDGKTLASCSADTSIRFWDTTTWKEILPSLTLKEFGHSLAFSPNGRTLASDSRDGTVKLWNVATRHELASLRAGDVGYISFSPDGQTLACWYFDKSLRLFRAPRPWDEA
jgi:WD40 repeat protein